MSTETKLRRGTSAQCAAGTPVEGELWIDLTNDRVRLGDGVLAGGHQMPNAVDMQKGSFNTINAGGTADAITATLDPVPVSYFTHMTVIFKASATNTGATTLDVNGLGVKNIYKVTGGALGALAAGDLTVGAYYTVRYDGTQFVLEGSAGGVSSVTGSAGIVVTPTTGAPDVSIDTNNADGIGSYLMLFNTGSSVSSGSIGGVLRYTYGTATGFVNTGTTAIGTYRCVNGTSVGTNQVGLFIRIA